MGAEAKSEFVPKQKKSRLKWFLLADVVVLFVLCVLIFSRPESMPVSTLRLEDVMLQGMLINRVHKELRADPPLKSSTLRLTPDQIESLLRIGDVASEVAILAGKYPGPAVRYLRFRQVEDAVELQFPLDTKLRFLFGGEIRFFGRFMLKKEGPMVTIQLQKLRIGMLPLPAFLFGTREFDLRKVKNGEDWDRMIQAFSFDKNGNLTLVYSPDYASGLISAGLSGR